MIQFSLKDKVALITGASRGIGEAIALTLAEYGAECVLVGRKIDALQTVADGIVRKGGKAHPMACNMGDMKQIDNLIAEIREKFGKLDILVNNAATNPFFGEMVNADEGVWDKINDVNLKGPFFTIQKAVPLMTAAGGGAVVNVSSVNGLRSGIFQGIYSITKAALISMTQAYAKELAGKNIRVNALLPGLTDTKFSKALIDNEFIHKEIVKMIPMGRVAKPMDMAGAVLYLVSDASSYTTGACLICDGGFLA
jgi:NAD(P)-dependent dehydrogenase (short-subunit alcohol dehydrogenase family)